MYVTMIGILGKMLFYAEDWSITWDSRYPDVKMSEFASRDVKRDLGI